MLTLLRNVHTGQEIAVDLWDTSRLSGATIYYVTYAGVKQHLSSYQGWRIAAA